jgi:hypothetical protein
VHPPNGVFSYSLGIRSGPLVAWAVCALPRWLLSHLPLAPGLRLFRILPHRRNSAIPYRFSKDFLPFSVLCGCPCTPALRSCSESVQSARALEATIAGTSEELERDLCAYNGVTVPFRGFCALGDSVRRRLARPALAVRSAAAPQEQRVYLCSGTRRLARPNAPSPHRHLGSGPALGIFMIPDAAPFKEC